jgi:hypothetical protein
MDAFHQRASTLLQSVGYPFPLPAALSPASHLADNALLIMLPIRYSGPRNSTSSPHPHVNDSACMFIKGQRLSHGGAATAPPPHHEPLTEEYSHYEEHIAIIPPLTCYENLRTPAGDLIAVKIYPRANGYIDVNLRQQGSRRGSGRRPRHWSNGNILSIDAHRLILFATQGPPASDDLIAMHLCDTSHCVNPRHLTWGTYSANTQGHASRQLSAEGYMYLPESNLNLVDL